MISHANVCFLVFILSRMDRQRSCHRKLDANNASESWGKTQPTVMKSARSLDPTWILSDRIPIPAERSDWHDALMNGSSGKSMAASK